MAIVGRMGNRILVGLEEKNLEKLRDGQPFHQFLSETIGLPYELVLFYGKTMSDLERMVATNVGPDTVVVDHRERRKN